MKKLVMAVIMLLVMTVSAQEISSHLDLGLEVGVPSGDTKDLTNFGLGASVKASFPLGRAIDLTGRLGYIWWAEGEYEETRNLIQYTVTSDYYHIPMLAGARLKMPAGLYAMGELGITVIGGTHKEAIEGVTTLDKSNFSDSEVGYSLGAGLLAGNIDLSVTYNAFNDWEHIGFRIGFIFM